MADSESAQTYGPPEWMEQHVINQALVLKDIVLALSSELEDRKTRRGGKKCSFLSFELCFMWIRILTALLI